MEILFKSAFEIAEYVKAKAVSSREVVSFYLDRIETFNPQINACLLYTSPSPRDVEESRMPSSA